MALSSSPEELHDWAASMVMPSSVPAGMRLELARSRIVPGRTDRATEWMHMLNERYDECVATLRRERVVLEATFRHVDDDGVEWIYHLTLAGDDSPGLDPSSSDIDRDHDAFGRECKEPGWELLQPELLLAPDGVRSAMVEFLAEARVVEHD